MISAKLVLFIEFLILFYHIFGTIRNSNGKSYNLNNVQLKQIHYLCSIR